MKQCLLILILLFSSYLASLQPLIGQGTEAQSFPWSHTLTQIVDTEGQRSYWVVQDCNLYGEGWQDLPQPQFWNRIMAMDKERSLVNIAATRKILGEARTSLIDSMEEKELLAYKDSVRKVYELDEEEKLYVTSGKNDYYQFHAAIQEISRSIDVFHEEGVDPWYAQAILLIESPGFSRTSPYGARGAFQLMRRVAIEQGLQVNSRVDERDDPKKSAGAAARLIKKVCLPRTRQILDTWNIPYQENEIWFKLMVLHVYHAGYRNVRDAVNHIRPTKGGKSLIRELWQTTYRRFGNASQNYSQLVLASMIRLDKIILEEFEIRCHCCD
jgi:hypothetical protein